MEDYLYHYGVKGMKWGVRRTPEQLGHHKITLKKGSTVQRVVADPNFISKDDHVYVSYKALDNLTYVDTVSDLTLYQMGESKSEGYVVKLKITDDIVAPSYKKSVDSFIDAIGNSDYINAAYETYRKTKNSDSSKIKEVVDYYKGKNSDSDIVRKTKDYIEDPMNVDNMLSLYSEGEDVFNTVNFIEQFKHNPVSSLMDKYYLDFNKSLAYSDDNRKVFFDNLKRQGYNAVVDHHDAYEIESDGRLVEGHSNTPLIVFEKDKTLSKYEYRPIDNDLGKLGFMAVEYNTAKKEDPEMAKEMLPELKKLIRMDNKRKWNKY